MSYENKVLLNLLVYQIKKTVVILIIFSAMTVLTGVLDVIFFHRCAMFFIVLSLYVCVSTVHLEGYDTYRVSSNMISFDAYTIFIETDSFCGYC